MPVLEQLPLVGSVSPDNRLLIEQDGTTGVVTVGTLLQGLQPAISLAGGVLLGRSSPGLGIPEAVGVGSGLALAGGALVADQARVAFLDSPNLTGHPTAPTPPANDASSAIATTAFVASRAAPASSVFLTGAVNGSGQTGQQITTTLSPVLPAVDGSALTVAAGIAGAVKRPLSETRAEVIRVSDLLGAKPNGQDASNAMIAALGLAATMPGATVELAAGTWNFASITASLVVPARTTIRGAGRHLTRVVWNDTGSFSLFKSAGTSAARAADIEFTDLTVSGSWQTNGVGSSYPFLLYYVDGLSFRNICVEYSRIIGIVARNCTNVAVRDCVVRYCARDGINLAECAAVTIDGNTVEHCDDDGIAVHSDIYDPWLVRKNVVISNNRVFDCQGIKVLAPRATAVTGNVVDCCRAQGISFATDPLSPTDTEGMSAAMVSLICGNVVTNIISRQNIDNLNQGCPGIFITGDSARAGSLGAIPGENKTSSATVIDPYPYYAANSNLSTVATMGSHSLIIADNFIGRILPACNGTVTTPKVYARYSDYGFGQIFTRSGWMNPQLSESDMRDHGIVVQAGVVRDVLISGNIIRGVTSGLALLQATRLENIVFRNNQVIDCRTYGVLVNTTGALRAYVEQNIFDLDPFFKASGRGANGTWSTLGEPTGIRGMNGSGMIVRGNVFRNMCRDSDIASDTVNSGWLFDGNIVEADPSAVGFSTANKGVGQVRAAAGTLLAQAECNPGSANFGRILTTPTGAAIAMPNAGKWLSGHFVRNAAPAPSGGLMTLGWSRLTTGSAHVLGSDWAAAQVVGGSVAASLVLAGPASGSAAPGFRQLTAADVANVQPAPAVTTTYTASGALAVTDNVAVVNAAGPVSMTLDAGASDGHQIVIKRIGVGAVSITATIDGAGGSQILMNSATMRESATLAWSAGLGSWLII